MTRLQQIILVGLCLLVLLPSDPVRADVVKPALVEISVHADGHCTVELRASLEALLTGINARYRNTQDAPNAADYDALRVLSAADLRQAFEPFHARLTREIRLLFDGEPAALTITDIDIPEPGYTKVPRNSAIYLACTVPDAAKVLSWYYPAAFGDNAVRVRQVNNAAERWHWSAWQWLRTDRASDPFSLTEVYNPPGLVDTVTTYLVAGFEHILPKGIDHILFILGIFLLSLKLRPLLWQVTMFTVAHTITLGLTMAGYIELPARIVEPLIALSIAYIGIENIFARRLHNSRLLLVFGFGLLHGMGFASVLQEFGMPDDDFLTALISFNVGVEIGQLFVILAAFLAVGLWFGRSAWYRPVIVIGGSALIALTGLYWTWDRLQFA